MAADNIDIIHEQVVVLRKIFKNAKFYDGGKKMNEADRIMAKNILINLILKIKEKKRTTEEESEKLKMARIKVQEKEKEIRRLEILSKSSRRPDVLLAQAESRNHVASEKNAQAQAESQARIKEAEVQLEEIKLQRPPRDDEIKDLKATTREQEKTIEKLKGRIKELQEKLNTQSI